MACCIAEKYKWCKDLETIYTDEEGKDYCVFHAPKGHKGVSVEKFNDLIFKRIEEAKNFGQKCNLSGTIFEGLIKFNQFDKKNPLPDIDFSFTIFTEYADFLNTHFSGETNFKYAKFSGKTNFFFTQFCDHANFEITTFKRYANFDHSTFCGAAIFTHATFNKYSSFEAITFKGMTDFDGVFFEDKVKFSFTTFDGPVYFGGTSTAWTFSFSSGKILKRFLVPTSEEPRLTFKKNAIFKKTTFTEEASFCGCLTEGIISFEEVDLSHVSFLATNPNDFNFIYCKWPKKGGRDVLYDEIQIKSPKDKKAFEQVEGLYRRLKQKYKKELNEPEISNWHYGEKEMFRKKSMIRRYNPLSLSNLYWASSGYGECPVRSGIMLLLLFILVTTGMNFFGLIPFGNEKSVFEFTEINGFSGSFDWEKFKLLVFNIIQYALFFKTPFFKPETINGYIFQSIFTRLLIPMQATLFVFALRNNFRR